MQPRASEIFWQGTDPEDRDRTRAHPTHVRPLRGRLSLTAMVKTHVVALGQTGNVTPAEAEKELRLRKCGGDGIQGALKQRQFVEGGVGAPAHFAAQCGCSML